MSTSEHDRIDGDQSMLLEHRAEGTELAVATGLVQVPHVIAGHKVHGDAQFVVLDAPDRRPVWWCASGGRDDVEAAVDAARAGLEKWRRASSVARAETLGRAAALLRERSEDIARKVVVESGKTISQARGEVGRAAGTLEDYASLIRIRPGSTHYDYSPRVWGLELMEPIGIAAIISTWNLPLQIAAMKVGAALAAGCAVVVKSSPLAPATPCALAEVLIAAGVPDEAVSVLHGDAGVAAELIRHPEVRVVSFTGRDSTGRAVMAAAAMGTKKVILELGGKSANIVFADADLDEAIPGVVSGFVRNQGATCTAGSRVLVARPVFEQVLERVGEQLEGLRVGDPFDAQTEIGAVRTSDLFDTIQEELYAARARGGMVRAGTPVAVDGRGGAYMRPGIVTGLPNSDPLAQRELFGPIAVITPFDTVADAVTMANASGYGLAAGVWSRDLARVEEVWRRLDVGTVYVNSYHRLDGIPMPAAGRQASGFGAEGGLRGIEEFSTTKSVHIPRAPTSAS